MLRQEAKRLYLFTKGGDSTLSNNKREIIFIQMLEGLSAEEAEFLVAVVNKKVNNKYKGFTGNLVKEAFNWNDDFMKNDNKIKKLTTLLASFLLIACHEANADKKGYFYGIKFDHKNSIGGTDANTFGVDYGKHVYDWLDVKISTNSYRQRR